MLAGHSSELAGARDVGQSYSDVHRPDGTGPPESRPPWPAGHLTSPGERPGFCLQELIICCEKRKPLLRLVPRGMEGIWDFTMPSLRAAQPAGSTRSRHFPQDGVSSRERVPPHAGQLKRQVSVL